jgi:hypothetical protein
MSTKIHEGAKLEGVITIAEALSFIEDIRNQVTEILFEESATEIKTLACLINDLYSVGIDMFQPDENERKPLLAATLRYMTSDRNDDTEYSIAIGAVDKHVLAIPYFQNNTRCYEVFYNHPNVSRFGYWDNTDKDPEVSAKEWKLRGKLWDKLFNTQHIPARAMFVIVLQDKNHLIPLDRHMNTLPTLDDRIKSCASHIAWLEVTETLTETNKLNMYQCMLEVKKLQPTIMERIKDKLQPNLTLSDLEKPIPELIQKGESDGS